MIELRFERGRDDVMGPTYGPYEFIQFTYGNLRIPEDRDLAFRNNVGDWEICDGGPHDGCHYSDVIIYHPLEQEGTGDVKHVESVAVAVDTDTNIVGA